MFIKFSTKRGQGLVAGARRNLGSDIHTVYGKPSSAKVSAWRACRNEFDESLDHHNFRITGKNCNYFTVAWECKVEYTNPKTGEVTMERVTHIDTGMSVYEVLLDR